MIKNIKSKTELSGFYVMFDNTITNEKMGYYGVSHFIEHLVCKNIEPLLEDLEKNGIDWNAYTSTEHINFYITGLDEYVNQYKETFLSHILNFDISEKRFEIEKNVIIKEYIDTMSYRHNKHFYNVYRKYFNFYHVIGRIEDIKNISLRDCLEYYEKNFTKPNRIFNVSKKYKFDSNIEFSKETRKRIKIKKGNFDNKDIDYYYHEEKFNNVSIIYISDVIYDDFAYLTFLNSLLSRGKNSPFWRETREKHGDTYYTSCSMEKLCFDSGVLSINTQTTPENVNRLIDSINTVISNKEIYITKERFENMKKYFDIYYKKLDQNRYINISSYANPEKWNMRKILKTITYEKLLEIFDKYYNLNKFTISIDSVDFKSKL